MRNLSVVTNDFAFEIGRPVWQRPYGWRWWDRWFLRIGFVGREAENEMPYHYWAGIDIQLLPNFIWWQDLIGIEHGIMKVHNRIVGIQSWPFMRFCGGRP